VSRSAISALSGDGVGVLRVACRSPSGDRRRALALMETLADFGTVSYFR
jgi:hypothetical protein